MKLCQIYNSAAHYREEIFRLMDQTFDCNYIFGLSLGDIKQMDTSVLQGRVTKVKNRYIGSFYWQPHVIRHLLRKYDTYLILGDTRCLSTWIFCIFARLFRPRKRVFFWSHGWYGKETPVEKFLKKVFFRLPNGGTFLYGHYARKLMIAEGFNPQKLYVIHNSLAYHKQLELRNTIPDEPVYQKYFGNDNPNLIFVGRLTKVKKLDMIVRAIALSKDKGKEYNMTFVGDGAEKDNLIALAEELGVVGQIWFYGACYDERSLSRLIYNADLCVSPGNVGLTAIHAMTFGTPVISHNDFPHQMPEFESILDGETGTFFHANDVEDLAKSIERWFKGKEKHRNDVRQACYHEIDTQWTPQFQIEVLQKHLS